MKKYNVTFSFFNLFEQSSAEVVKLQGMIKAGTATIATTTYVASSEGWVLLVGAIGFVLDTLAACLHFEKLQ